MKYEKWSLGYELLKQYVRFADWLIYNKTIITGKEKIPKNKPILFVPNHQNALSDPMAVLLNTRFQPVWLARADIFKNKFAALILRFLKIMPVYRLRDGKDKLGKNEETFNNSIRVLKNNGALALFPEAAHTGKRQMIAHKKAAPRIVFMTQEKADVNLDIQIVPTGIYYSSYWKFDRNLIVKFGEPIPVNQYLDTLKQSEREATEALRTDIRRAMEEIVLDIKSKNYYSEFEQIREYYGKHFCRKNRQEATILNQFLYDRILVGKLDKSEQEHPEEIEQIVALTNDYSTKLKKYKLRSWLVEDPGYNAAKILINKLILLIGLPVFIYGFVFNALPFLGIDFFTRKKIKDNAFRSSFSLVLGIVVFPLVYLIELAAVSFFIPGFWLKLAFIVSLPFAGKLAFKWYKLLRKTIGRTRYMYLRFFAKDKINKLMKDQINLFEKIDNLLL